MNGIKLDLQQLLGFKIIATGDSKTAVRSPKIGTKNCSVNDADALASGTSSATAKIGAKIGTKGP